MNEIELVLSPSKFMWKNFAINNTLVLDDDDYMGICRHSGSIDKATAEHIRTCTYMRWNSCCVDSYNQKELCGESGATA